MANIGFPVLQANDLLQAIDLPLLLLKLFPLFLDLLLLFLDRVDEHGRDLSVFHSFDLALRVSRSEKRLDTRYVDHRATRPRTPRARDRRCEDR